MQTTTLLLLPRPPLQTNTPLLLPALRIPRYIIPTLFKLSLLLSSPLFSPPSNSSTDPIAVLYFSSFQNSASYPQTNLMSAHSPPSRIFLSPTPIPDPTPRPDTRNTMNPTTAPTWSFHSIPESSPSSSALVPDSQPTSFPLAPESPLFVSETEPSPPPGTTTMQLPPEKTGSGSGGGGSISPFAQGDDDTEDEDSLFIPERRRGPSPAAGLGQMGLSLRPRPSPSLTPAPGLDADAHPAQEEPLPTTHTSPAARMPPPPLPSAGPSRASSTAAAAATSTPSVRDKLLQFRQSIQARRSLYSAGLPSTVTSSSASSSSYSSAPPTFALAPVNWDLEAQADARAVSAYEAQRAHYENLRATKGSLTFGETITWNRIYTAEKERRGKLKRDMEIAGRVYEAPPMDTGRSEGTGGGNGGNRAGSGSGGADVLNRLISPSPTSAEPSSSHVSMQDAELASFQVALDAATDSPRKSKKRKNDEGRGRKSAKSRDKGKGKARNVGASSASETPRTSSRRGRKTKQDEQARRQAASLFTHDVFAHQPQEDAREQPTFSARNQRDALAEMIASIPIKDLQEAKDDRNSLIRDLKDFDGKGTVRSDGHSMWKVKGMASSLKSYQIMGTAFMRYVVVN